MAPLVDELINRLDRGDDVAAAVADALIAALQEGVRLGAVEVAAQAQRHGVRVQLRLDLPTP